MMAHDELLHLPVQTRSGDPVGKIVGFRIDEESQSIIQYEVKQGMIRGKTLLIHRTQVVELNAQHMVVEDGSLMTPEEEVVCA